MSRKVDTRHNSAVTMCNWDCVLQKRVKMIPPDTSDSRGVKVFIIPMRDGSPTSSGVTKKGGFYQTNKFKLFTHGKVAE